MSNLKGAILKMSYQQNSNVNAENVLHDLIYLETRPDTRLPKSRAGGQGLYLRSLDHLGRSSEHCAFKIIQSGKSHNCDFFCSFE